MGRGVKLTIIIAVGLIVAGGLLSRLGLSLEDWGRGSDKMEKQTASYDGGKISGITADCDSLNIDVFPTDGSDITLEWYDDEYRHCELCEENGTLKVTYREARKWYDYLRFGFRWGRFETCTLSIGLPSSYKGPLSLHTASGKITAGDLRINGDLTAEASSGVIEISNVIAEGSILLDVSSGNIKAESLTGGGDADIKTVSGNLTVSSLALDGDLYAKCSSGVLKLSDVSGAEKVSVGATSGNINLSVISADEFDISTTSGSIRFEDIYAEESIALSAASGNIRGTINDSVKSYSITSSCLSGNSNLPKNAEYGDKTLTAKVMSGNINIEFTE
jgi:DUF4097 and DUF4098 domain-containing protein YvlB